jgi:uncharacterized protein (DUF4415 family)
MKGASMKREYNLKKMKMRRGPVLDAKKTKVQKTLRFDMDVLSWFFIEGERRGLGYQTLINLVLREYMQAGGTVLSEARVRDVVREEIKKSKKAS